MRSSLAISSSPFWLWTFHCSRTTPSVPGRFTVFSSTAASRWMVSPMKAGAVKRSASLP